MTNNSHSQLLLHCVQILDSFNYQTRSLEDQVTQYFHANQDLFEDDECFINEVFSGSVRYASIIQVIIDGYYAEDGKKTLRSEVNLYKVLCYIILFRLDEIGLPHLRKFILSQDIKKMHRFLNFFLNEQNLLTWVLGEWNKQYEDSFVENTLMIPIKRWLPDLTVLIQNLKDRIDNKIKPQKNLIPTTDTKPFHLTERRARSVPFPQAIPRLQKAKPLPITNYKRPSEFEKINKIKVTNRKKAEDQLKDASRQQFACANPEKSLKTKIILAEIQASEEAKMDFDKHKAKGAPALLNKDVPIKLNTAAILREGKLYKERQEEIIKKLENLEAGAKDGSEFLEWQSKMRQRDIDGQLAEIERRILEGKLSREDAILARQNLITENKTRVQDMKQETQQLMQEYMEQRFKEEQEMRQLVENTLKGHRNTKNAKIKLQEYKQKLVLEVNEENQELMKEALEKAEAELRRKMALIHQIRAMEAVPLIRCKFVDLAETAGAGLLSEMSIVELRERLALLKTAEKETEEQKRDQIIADKEAKDQVLIDTLSMISKHRVEQNRAAALKYIELEKKKYQAKDLSAIVPQDEKLADLQRKLEEKRAQRIQEITQNRITPDRSIPARRTASFDKQKQVLEENRWRELESAKERLAELHAGSAANKSPMWLAS